MHKVNSFLLASIFLYSTVAIAQDGKYAVDASIIGGKDQLEQVLQTQLTLPKTLMTGQYQKDIIAYFDVGPADDAINIKFDGMTNNVLRKELTRLFGLMKFNKALNAYNDPYFLTFSLSTDKYNHYYKQRSKLNLKKDVKADSSQIVYTKADLAPEYYKNGEPGMEEFVLTSMEYPKLAIEKSVEGTVVIDFIVETNGYITGATLRQPVGAGCSDEALRVIKLTKWQPAMLDGKYVRYKTSYPITFSLRNISNDNSSSSKTMGQ